MCRENAANGQKLYLVQMQNIKYISMKAVLIQISQGTMHMQYMGNVHGCYPDKHTCRNNCFVIHPT